MSRSTKSTYIDFEEDYQKSKKKGNKTNENGYIDFETEYQLDKFNYSLPSRLESLTSSRNEMSKNYNSRFFDKDGNYINSYRGDTKDALSSFETSRANATKEYESLLSDLSKYEKYLDAEKVKTLKDYLTTYGSDMQSMYDTYKLDSDTYSRYADEDAYNRAMAYAKEQDEKVKRYSSMTDDELEAELKALEDSKKGNAFTNFAMKFIGAQQDVKLYSQGESNQAHNESVDYDIALIEKEKTNRKYKQIDELPGSVKTLVDELTVIDSTKDDEEFANKMGALLSGFTGGNNVNYNVGSGSERRGEIIRELESMGVKNWQELLDYNKLRYNEKKNAATKDEYAQMAKEHPVLSSFVSIPASLGKGIGTLEMLENIGSDVPLDPNSPYFGMNDLSNNIRETVMDEHDYHLNTGIEAIDNIDINDEIYSLFMSTGDSVMAGLGGMGVKGLGGSVLGLSAASDAAQEVAERGGSSTEAIATGIAAGAFEMLGEALSLGKLDELITNGVKKRGFVPFVKALLKSMGINASEEFNTEAANILGDYIINGGASTYAETVKSYLSVGYTIEEARKLADKDMLAQMGKAGVSGALQGLLMGVGGGALSTTANAIDSKSYENKFYNKMGSNVVENNNVSQLAEEAKSLGNSKLRKLANVAEAVNVGELDPKEAKKYVHQVGKLYKGVQKAQFESLSKTSETAFRNVIKAELEKTGVADTDATADILVKAMHNKGLTRAENRKFQSVDGRSILDKVLYSAEFNKTLDAEQKKQFTEGFDKFVNTESLAGRTLTDRKADLVSKAGYKSGAEKTSVDATDEVVDSLKVNSIKGDTITLDVKLGENNQVVAADELTFDNDYAVIISGLQSISKDFGLDVDSANRVLALWESYDGDSFDFYKTAQSGIMYGQYNQKKYFDNATFGNVPDNIRNELYNIGKEYRQKVTDTKAKAIKERSIPNGEVKVTFAEGVQYHKLTKSQKAQVDMAQIIARAFGFNLEVFRSPKVNGKSVGENGSFSPSANIMRLDIDAGTLDGKALILFTQGHELTHFIKAWSETAYKNFADFLIEKYTDKDVPLNDLVQKKIRDSIILAQSDKTGKHKELSYDEALEEVVCDACEDFLADPNIQQTILEITKVDQSLADKIKNFIKNLINRLEKALRGLQGQSDAAAYTRSLDANDLQELKDLWTSALIDARENVLQAKARGGETQKNTTAEGDAKEQARFKGHTNIEKNGKKRYNKRSFYSSFDSLAMNWAYHPDTQVGDTNIFFRNNVAVLVEATENGFIEISSGKYEKVRSVYEQAHRETNRGLYANLSRIESRRGTDSWDLQYAEDGRYDVRDAQQNESQGFQTDSERDDEHLWSGDKREPVKRQDRDSLGRTLSETQQSYFADSKIRDKNGNLMVMYHGSPKDDISSFRLSLGGAYFTANSDYAREYARDVGKVYEVYLNITKPFDTRNAECRAIFEKEFYGQWGNGAPLGDKGLPDWTDGDDLIDFLQEKGYDYDGLLLDEGGVPVGNGVKDRGISYVVFDRANQVKYTDNLNPTTNEDMKFAMRENVEETKDLVAVHGMAIQNLMSSLELGGLPMPSIAIIKARMGHNRYGDVSLVFGKDTIDPELNKANKVYGLDVWSPVYPTIEFKVNEAVASKIRDKYYKLGKKYGYDDVRPLYAYAEELERQLNNAEGEQGLLEDLYNDVGLMKVYLLDSGKPKVEPVTVEERTTLSDMDVESFEFLIGEIGRDVIDEFVLPEGVRGPWAQEHRKAFWDKHLHEVQKAYGNMFIKLDNFTEEDAKKIVDNTSRFELNGWLNKIVSYIKNGKVRIKVTEDRAATEEAIKKAAQDGYVEWVNDLFKGVAEKSGIRNNVDYFDKYGNRRDWEALHYANKLENVVKVMKARENGASFFNAGALWAIAAKDYGTIQEIKADSGRLELLSEDEYSALKKAIGARIDEIADSLNSKYSDSNYFIEHDNKINNLFDAIKSSKTKSGVLKYLNEYFTNATETTVTDLLDVVADAGNLPTEYFEAKPQRAVMFDEVKAVIIPDNAPQELREQLDSMKLNVLTYEHGNDNSRTEVLNSIEDVKFQDRVTPEQDAEYLELAKNPKKNETRLREMVDAVARANGYTIKAYHATNAKFTAFDVDKTSDINYHGKGIYFTNSTRDVENNYENYEGPDPWNKIEARAYELASEKYDLSYEDTLSGDVEVIDKINECYDEAIAEFKSTIHRITAYLKFDNPFVLKKGGAFTGTYDMSKHDGVIDEQVYENIGHSGMDENTVHYVVRNPRNIKSADLVTYDDNGNIIPLSERFNEVNKDIRYQDRDSTGRKLTKEQQDYFKDSKIRVREVDGWKNTISENGALFPVYHGTYSDEFFEFDKGAIGSANDIGWYGKGFYFAFDKREAEFYGNRVLECYLNVKKPFFFSEEMQSFDGQDGGDVNFDFASFVINLSEKFPEIAQRTFLEVAEFNSDDVIDKSFTDFAKEIKEIYDSNRFKIVEVEDNGETTYQYLFSRDVDNIETSERIKNIIKENYIDDSWSAKYFKDKGVITDDDYNEILDLIEKYGESQFNAACHDAWVTGRFTDIEFAKKNRLSAVISYLANKRYSYINQHIPEYYMEHYVGDTLSQELRKKGYDGILQSRYGDEIVVFEPNQIKLTNNKKPTSNSDIRYQDRPYQPSLEDLGIDYKAENDKLKADVDRLNKLLKFQRTLTHGALFTKTSVDKAASLIMKEFGLHRGKSDLSEKLNALYTFVASSNDLTWDEFYDRASQVANWMIDSKPDQRYYKNPYASEVLKNIRERGITLNEKQKEEAAYYAGSLNAYRKSNIGNFRIVNEGGISLTELWEQLVEDYPGAFSQEDIEKGKKDTNLPSLIVEVIGTMRQTESVLEQMDRTQEVRKMVEKIYDTYWNVTTLHTLADKHQKEVNLLKGKHRAEMDALKEKGDENLKQAKERYREMLQKVREDKDAKMTAYKEHVAEQRHKSVEGRNKTATKNKIKRVVQALASLYNNPTKERNVKVEFQDMVDKALVMADAIFDNGNISVYDILSSDIPNLRESERKDLEKWRENQKLKADYQRELDELEASEKLDQATHDKLLKNISECNRKLNYYSGNLKEVIEMQRDNLNDHAIQDAIDSLVSAYKSLNESTEGYAEAAYNEYVNEKLVALKEALKNTTIKTMTQTQLDELYQAYKMVLTTVRKANELFIKNKKMTVADAGEAVMREVQNVTKVTENKVLMKQHLNKFMWEELKPVYAFERIGSETFMNLYKELLRGQSVFGRDIAETQDFFQRKSKAYNYDSWDLDERRDFRLADGRTFTISLQEIMSIYAYSKREQALDHIAKGGFVFDSNEFFTDTKEKGIKGKIKKVRTTVEAYRLNDDMFYKVINSLTAEQKKFVDDMQDYLSTVMGAKGNEVSRVLYGIDLFQEKYYFPLMSSHDFIQQTNNPAGEVALKNSGMAKATVPHARNPIILKGFMDVWTEHTNKMSTYHAFVLPIENLNKVFNYTGYATDNKSVSVQTILNGAYGPAVNQYITTLLRDLNGGIKVQGSGNWVTKGISLFKKTAVAASTSVVIQQPTAIVRALAMIDGKYFVHGRDGLKHNEAWDELKKYAPIAVIKEMGGFDVGGGKQVAEYIAAKSYKGKDKIKGFFTDSKYRDNALMWGASKADEFGWITIWSAVKKEIAETTTYKVGSEEFLQACGERFTEVIDYTQVYDSVLSRSGFMRNKGEISKMATSFMGEPTTSFNMLYNAVLQLKRGNISKLGATKIVGATMASIVFAAIAKSLIYALRDDDEDESYVEKYAQALTDSLKSDLFIPNMLPYVSDITSLLSGWDVERTDMAILKDLKDAVDGLDSSSKSPYRKVEDLAGAIAAFGGIPLKNVMRTTREMYNAVANIFDGNTAGEGDILDAIEETAENAFYGNIIVDKITGGYSGGNSASDVNVLLDKGNTAKAKEIINDLVAEKVESGKTEKEAKASIKASVTSYWKDLYLQAYRNKDNAEMLRIRRILQATGLYDDVLTTCSNWIKGMKDETTDTGFTKW